MLVNEHLLDEISCNSKTTANTKLTMCCNESLADEVHSQQLENNSQHRISTFRSRINSKAKGHGISTLRSRINSKAKGHFLVSFSLLHSRSLTEDLQLWLCFPIPVTPPYAYLPVLSLSACTNFCMNPSSSFLSLIFVVVVVVVVVLRLHCAEGLQLQLSFAFR